MAVRNIDSADRRASALVRLRGALNGEDIVAGLQAAAPGGPLCRGKIRRCTARRVHFGSNIGIVVDYDLEIQQAGAIGSVRAFGQIPWQDTHAVYARAKERLAMQPVAEMAGSDKEDDPVAGIVLLEQLGVIVRAVGFDERVRGLRVLRDPDYRESKLIKPLAESGVLPMAGPSALPALLTHRLGKRAVLRLASKTKGGASAGNSLIVKLYKRNSGLAERTKVLHHALAPAFAESNGRLSVSPVLISIPELEAAVMPEAPGRSLAASGGRERLAAMTAAGEALARLHDASVEGIDDYGIDDEIALLARWVEFIGAYAPGRQSRFHRALKIVARTLETTDPAPMVPIHRDFHEGQIIVSGTQATLIDFDTVRIGDPAQDVGNFLAHLLYAELVTGEKAEPAICAFTAAYGKHTGRLSRGHVNAHVSATLLRLALIHYFSQCTGHLVDALLDKVECS